MAKKPGLVPGFLLLKKSFSTANILNSVAFLPNLEIPSPQGAQNLVNYHPIFCPNAANCWSFV